MPDAEHEALRDLVRSRFDAKDDVRRAQHRLSKFLLRQGVSPSPEADARTLLLYHFNGDLRDASNHHLELKADAKRALERKGYRFAERPPGWISCS